MTLRPFHQARWNEPVILEMSSPGERGILVPEAEPELREAAGDPTRGPRYFVKPDDRGEVNDLRQPNLDRAEALEQTLRRYVEASRQSGPLQAPAIPELNPTEG